MARPRRGRAYQAEGTARMKAPWLERAQHDGRKQPSHGAECGCKGGGGEEVEVGWRRAPYAQGAIGKSPTTYLTSPSQWTCELDAFMPDRRVN